MFFNFICILAIVGIVYGMLIYSLFIETKWDKMLSELERKLDKLLALFEESNNPPHDPGDKK